MDHPSPRDSGFGVDLESGVQTSDEDLSCNKPQNTTSVSQFCNNVEGGFSPESVKVVISSKMLDGEEALYHIESITTKEKRKKSGNNKKALKPPRPPRGPSLDAADQKLVREISELAMLKRARVERMRALKKMKAAKTASSSPSNFLAMVFTVLFCLVILYHGMSCRSSAESERGSSGSAGTNEDGLILVQFYPIPSAVVPNGPGSQSPNMVEQVAGSDPQEKLTRYTG